MSEPTFSKLPIGNQFHLGTIVSNMVNLDTDSLTMHSLLCGTTGVGKSNTSYHILQHLPEQVHYLVIEPAKGEYKDTFGDTAAVYGTNPYLTPMLRLNPFRFYQNPLNHSTTKHGIHILEHLDRLATIFNVCWPMEAAMPAVLKNALEQAYVAAGWDLQRSENHYSNQLFPSFEDVMHQVYAIVEQSDYSDENKGNYIGALCTRLNDLTNGLNGMIFQADDLTDEELFEKNVIVDLSRVGSPETKALIMGLLLMRLQEYRQCTTQEANASLRHLTILEEAHHLLRRTSMEQSIDRANLVGRSVEIISNAFAEMRTYGEGFLIIDQSPAQLDKSVIRNTNTKFVMRLPDQEDRTLVGKAIGLNEEQISELARLPNGVSAVYQNNWLEAVLVNIKQAVQLNHPYRYNDFDEKSVFEHPKERALEKALLTCKPEEFQTWLSNLGKNPFKEIASLQISTSLKRSVIDYYIIERTAGKEEQTSALAAVFYDYYHAEAAFRDILESNSESKMDPSDLEKQVLEKLHPTPEKGAGLRFLFRMLSLEQQRRHGHVEWLISQLLDKIGQPT